MIFQVSGLISFSRPFFRLSSGHFSPLLLHYSYPPSLTLLWFDALICTKSRIVYIHIGVVDPGLIAYPFLGFDLTLVTYDVIRLLSVVCCQKA